MDFTVYLNSFFYFNKLVYLNLGDKQIIRAFFFRLVACTWVLQVLQVQAPIQNQHPSPTGKLK